MPNDEATIGIMLKCRLKYKSPYLSGNIRAKPSDVNFENFHENPLYIYANFSMRPMWEDMLNIVKYQQIKNNLKTSQDTKMDIEQDP